MPLLAPLRRRWRPPAPRDWSAPPGCRAETGRNAPLRVEVVIDSLGYGGAEGLLADLVVGAREAGFSVGVTYLFERDGSPARRRLVALGVEATHVPLRGLVDPGGYALLRQHLRRVAPDVVHTHLDYADTVGGAVARSLGLPSVSTVHVMRWSALGLRQRCKAELHRVARRALAQRVVTVSEAARSEYLRQGWDRPSHVVTLHNGADARLRPGAGAALRARHGVRPDDVVLTMLSVLRPGKGHELVLSALDELPPGVRLLVAGGGPRRHDLECLASASSAGAPVVFLGHVEDPMEVLDATDILLHPSEFDAFPTALLQAMAASVPVVATAVGGIPEILHDGVNGVLLPARPDREVLLAALAPLLTDPSARRRMGTAGRRRYEAEFTAGRWAEQLRRLYETLV